MANYYNAPVVVQTYQPFQPDCGQIGRPNPFPGVTSQWNGGRRYPFHAGYVQTPVIDNRQLVNYNGVPYVSGANNYRGPYMYQPGAPAIHPYNGYYYNQQYLNTPNAASYSPCANPCREIYPGSGCNVGLPGPGLPTVPPVVRSNLHMPAVPPGQQVTVTTTSSTVDGVPSYYAGSRCGSRTVARYPGAYGSAITYPTTHSIPGPYLQSYMNYPGRPYGY